MKKEKRIDYYNNMPLEFDKKEDLRLRMAELEKKLAESEEKRSKLEKTCNVLIMAFREEEKMRCKALNKEYEKFLEDCSVRKRRNDIVLRSLCRIEDRSRALFAKTERLKLLKDRYISYIKVTGVKEDEIHSPPPLKTSTNSWNTNDVAPKFLQWRTPLMTYYKPEEPGRDSFSQSETSKQEHIREETSEGMKTPEVNIINGVKELVRTSDSQDESNSVKIGSDNIVKKVECLVYNREKCVSNKELLVKNIAEVTRLREKKVKSHQESIERLKKTFSFEISDGDNNEMLSPNNGKIAVVENHQNKAFDSPQNRFLNFNGNYEEKNRTIKEMRTGGNSPTGQQEEKIPSDQLLKSTKLVPMGLDGVDFQNEIYPESYYEQPVHYHNHTSIASDVILEEDETDLDEDDDKSFPESRPNAEDDKEGTPAWSLHSGHRTFGEPELMMESNKGHSVSESADSDADVKIRKFDTEEQQRSDAGKGEPVVLDVNKRKTNLVHLLDSESESFQIEHGNVLSGNDDSDFDFSFRQN